MSTHLAHEVEEVVLSVYYDTLVKQWKFMSLHHGLIAISLTNLCAVEF